MKAFTLLLLISFCSITVFAQESAPKSANEPGDTTKIENQVKEQDSADSVPEELSSSETENTGTSETKSFTLDANDAVVETIAADQAVETEIVTMDEAVETETIPAETTTYYYNNYNRHDDIQTLGGKNGKDGGFGAISFKATEFNDKDIIMAGFRGGWIINRAMAIGFEGYGIIPTAEYENINPDFPLLSRSVGGYGGMFLEPIILSNKVVHITFPVTGGAGWIGYIVDWEQNNNYYSDDLIDDDVFWYIEPGAALELNVARNFRINMGASYRFTEDLDLMSTSPEGFDAWNYFLTLKFGSF